MSNPLLQDLQERGTIETVSIALPTLGRFYEDGVLDPNADPNEIEIREIGIMAELSTRDPFLLASGKGMEVLIPQLCPAVLKPHKLAEIDIEAILIAGRIATHGNKMIVEHRCTRMVQDKDGKEIECGEENKIEVDLYDVIMRYNPIEFSDDFMVKLEEYGQTVYIRPVEYGVALNILKETMVFSKQDEEFNEMQITDVLTDETKIDEYSSLVMKKAVTTMEGIIESIFYVETAEGGKVFDKEKIKEWLLAISKDNVKKILRQAAKMNNTLNGKNTIKYKCAGCGKENIAPIELDIQRLFFFTPHNSNPEKTPSNISKRRSGRRKSP